MKQALNHYVTIWMEIDMCHNVYELTFEVMVWVYELIFMNSNFDPFKYIV